MMFMLHPPSATYMSQSTSKVATHACMVARFCRIKGGGEGGVVVNGILNVIRQRFMSLHSSTQVLLLNGDRARV